MKIQKVSAWASTETDRPIDLYHSSPKGWKNLRSPVVFIGGVHGDEPEGVQLAESTLAWLMETEAAPHDWALIPCLNPDGYAAQKRVNSRGVDINRNYPASNWSPSFDQDKYFPGQNAGSEKETQALVQLIETTQPTLLIHAHSWKPCIVCTGSPGMKDAHFLSEASGYKVVESIGYETPGSLSHYGWHDLKIPVLCIEESEGENKERSWLRFQKGIQKIFERPRDS